MDDFSYLKLKGQEISFFLPLDMRKGSTKLIVMKIPNLEKSVILLNEFNLN